jgi:hypothetical protein
VKPTTYADLGIRPVINESATLKRLGGPRIAAGGVVAMSTIEILQSGHGPVITSRAADKTVRMSASI